MKKLIIPNIKTTFTKLKPVKLPKYITPELAELIGIHLGDGNIYVRKSSYAISYCFNLKEKELIERTKYLFNRLFEKNLKLVQVRKGAVLLQCHSKLLCYFLNHNFSIPLGRKDNLIIPNLIKPNKKHIRSFLKGLHWTDGCTFIKTDKIKYTYPIIKITTKCKPFSLEIQQELIKLGFRATHCEKKGINFHGYDIILHGKEQYNKWITEVSDKKLIKTSGDTGIRISE